MSENKFTPREAIQRISALEQDCEWQRQRICSLDEENAALRAQVERLSIFREEREFVVQWATGLAQDNAALRARVANLESGLRDILEHADYTNPGIRCQFIAARARGALQKEESEAE